jgi:UTP--glucose-1-phosphate uridylyltransferase
VLCAQPLIGDEAFAVLLADDFMVSKQPVLMQLMAHHEQYACSVIAVNDVPPSDVHLYGIVSGTRITAQALSVRQMVEKPKPGQMNSTTAIVGRYVLTPAIFPCLQAVAANTQTGEIQLTDALRELLVKESVHGLRYEGKRYDCGSKLGMLQATIDTALLHPELSEKFATWLQQRSH